MQHKRTHGIISLGMIGVALFIGIVALAQSALLLALGYLVLATAALFGLLYAYCAKCACRGHCMHVLPGLLTYWVPRRRPGPYSALDYAGLALALGALILVPQPWLAADPALLVAFWALLAVALVEILAAVCPRCANTECPLLKLRGRPTT